MAAQGSPNEPRIFSHEDYTVGWVSALSSELAAAMLMLDERHEALPSQEKDTNTYVLGRMGKHNVVVACLPAGTYGTVSAATVAQNMARSFTSIRFGLMVGIGAGVPSKKHQVHLGDVVVGSPSGKNSGVVQYDFVRAEADGTLTPIGSLNRPPQILLTAVATLKAERLLGMKKIAPVINALDTENFEDPEEFGFPGAKFDRLFQPDYLHLDEGKPCEECDSTKVDPRSGDRPRLKNNEPAIHYGIVASGNQLVRNTALRARLRDEHYVCCIEMEAAGLMVEFPCLVVRGICDYADSHKNDQWQQYAALTAAVYAKHILSVVSPEQVKAELTVTKAMNVSPPEL